MKRSASRPHPNPRKTRTAKQLVREIKYLRSLTKDITTHYSLSVHGSLASIVRILETPPTQKKGVHRPNEKTMGAMLAALRSLTVKKKKGRAKDLRRIEVLAKKLKNLMPSQP